MLWLTRKTVLASRADLGDAVAAARLELGVTGGQRLVDHQDVGGAAVEIAKRSRAPMPEE